MGCQEHLGWCWQVGCQLAENSELQETRAPQVSGVGSNSFDPVANNAEACAKLIKAAHCLRLLCQMEAADLVSHHQQAAVWEVGQMHLNSMAGCKAGDATLRMLPAP